MENKTRLLKLFEEEIQRLLEALTLSAKEAHAAATHIESKAEDQYDTRALEASYLAGAQSRRAMELNHTLDTYRYLEVENFQATDPILATALIELQCEEAKSSYYLLMPSGGGLSVRWNDKRVQAITPLSPLGAALLGKRVGDEFSIQVDGHERDYTIVGVW